MLRYDRHKSIIDYVAIHKSASVHDICREFFISESTARRDIKHLCKTSALQRVHGGVRAGSVAADRNTPFFVRGQISVEKKKTIAKKAASLVKDGDVIIMDGSTTAYGIIPYLLTKRDLTIVTSSVKTAMASGECNIKTFATGGQMIPGSYSFYGQDAESMASRINGDIMFFSCTGISSDGMLTDRSIEENNVRKIMMSRAKKVIFLCDSSKFDQCYLHNLCHISEIDDMISDAEIPENIYMQLKK